MNRLTNLYHGEALENPGWFRHAPQRNRIQYTTALRKAIGAGFVECQLPPGMKQPPQWTGNVEPLSPTEVTPADVREHVDYSYRTERRSALAEFDCGRADGYAEGVGAGTKLGFYLGLLAGIVVTLLVRFRT